MGTLRRGTGCTPLESALWPGVVSVSGRNRTRIQIPWKARRRYRDNFEQWNSILPYPNDTPPTQVQFFLFENHSNLRHPSLISHCAASKWGGNLTNQFKAAI
ncbi:hypothetical protein AVEN_268415-1 [Araneus ventricosus]|uniref:Uncharacterized protein n=1 Tax=Araneus ventricosus TaxID=182803 RepID=A0A4Y2DTB7_ARAVE|nr:hypothetical protein AVEN_268415-1 [Araneus ventricosus]